MYLHIYQYSSLEYLPFWERHKILRAAAMKYDKWWFIRSYLQSIAYMYLPFVLLLTLVAVSEIGLIDKQGIVEAIRPHMDYLYIDEIIIGFAVIPSVIAYLRAVNSSGFEQIVETYLAVQRLAASLPSELNPVRTKRKNYAEPMPWASTENKLKRKGVFGQIVFIYVILIGATIITFTRMYPPKIAVNHCVEFVQVAVAFFVVALLAVKGFGAYWKLEREKKKYRADRLKKTTPSFPLPAITVIGIVAFLLFFHIVPAHLTVFPKRSPSFADTFVNVDEYLKRYTDQNFIGMLVMQASPLHQQLLEKGIIVSTTKTKN
jgi:amino acid transporter